MHGARGGAPTGAQNGNYRHGARTKAFEAQVLAARLLGALAAESLKGIGAKAGAECDDGQSFDGDKS